MRSLVGTLLIVAACTGSEDPVKTYEFGPYTIAPNQERTRDCVQISLNNDDFIYINSVELTTGPGFHHSNWLWVPDHVFPGEDGTYNCDDRGFDQAVAGIFGGVVFAQSTQNPHEIQAFPPGVALKVEPNAKLVTTIHLLNPTDEPITIRPNIKLGTIPEADVKTELAGIAFQNQALGLPANMQSKFTVECDLDTKHRMLFDRPVDFKVYYALAHYHELGTGMSVEAVKDDGTASTVYSTKTMVGDTLGGRIDPLFDFAGYTKLRFSCEYYNPRSEVVRWGNGDQEMCVFLAFSDSTYNWGGGVLDNDEPGNPMQVGNAMHFSNPCVVFANDATH